MASSEEIEARLAAVERELQIVRQDAAAARVLAGGADRDVSAFAARLDAQTKLLVALRETQVEQGELLGTLETKLQRTDANVQSVETEMRQGFGSVTTGQAEITTLLRRLLPGDSGE